jgi:hypothetical protein
MLYWNYSTERKDAPMFITVAYIKFKIQAVSKKYTAPISGNPVSKNKTKKIYVNNGPWTCRLRATAECIT